MKLPEHELKLHMNMVVRGSEAYNSEPRHPFFGVLDQRKFFQGRPTLLFISNAVAIYRNYQIWYNPF